MPCLALSPLHPPRSPRFAEEVASSKRGAHISIAIVMYFRSKLAPYDGTLTHTPPLSLDSQAASTTLCTYSPSTCNKLRNIDTRKRKALTFKSGKVCRKGGRCRKISSHFFGQHIGAATKGMVGYILRRRFGLGFDQQLVGIVVDLHLASGGIEFEVEGPFFSREGELLDLLCTRSTSIPNKLC